MPRKKELSGAQKRHLTTVKKKQLSNTLEKKNLIFLAILPAIRARARIRRPVQVLKQMQAGLSRQRLRSQLLRLQHVRTANLIAHCNEEACSPREEQPE